MFKNFFFTELKYVLKQKMVYLFLLIIALLVFGAVVSDSVIIGSSLGNVHRNSPYTITYYVTILSVFGVLFATAFFNNAALRENKYQFDEILFSTPINKFGFYFGRFNAALIISTIPLLGVFAGFFFGKILGPVFGWMPAERFGDFHFDAWINNYLIFILPNMFFSGAIIFALATKFKSTVISFVGALIVIVAYMSSGTLLSDISQEKIAALTDIFGVKTYAVVTKYFTPAQMNTQVPTFSGLLLYNRLIWCGAGFLILLLSYFNFSFAIKHRKVKEHKKKVVTSSKNFALPQIHQQFAFLTSWIQLRSFFMMNYRSITRSITFKILFIFALILMLVNFTGSYEYFGLKTYPVTYEMIGIIQGTSSLFLIIVLVFFSGELVWRDKENKIDEVIDSTAHFSLISVVAKFLSLLAAISILYFSLVLITILYQLFSGYTRIELSVYILNYFQTAFVNFFVYGAILILIQVLVKNKYIGYFISIVVIFLWEIILGVFHIESNMLTISGRPSLEYSDMSGFGGNVVAAAWFNLYWIMIAICCLFIAAYLWNRGKAPSLFTRIKTARKHASKKLNLSFISILVATLLIAGFVFYNTQILNPYLTSKQKELAQVEFEKKYKKYEQLPIPKIIESKYFVDLYPKDRKAVARVISTLQNQTNQPIDSILFNLNENWETTINLENAEIISHDKKLNVDFYRFKKALQPGEKVKLETIVKYEPKGFANNGDPLQWAENGLFFNNNELMPIYGYVDNLEITDKNKRKKYGLPERTRMPKLDTTNKEALMVNYLSDGRSDWINIKTTISTDGDQIAIAPGSLRKEWKENGRNYFTYQLDHASQNFFSFMSARYEKATRQWKGINLEVYYDKKHGGNVKIMLDAIQHAFEYYTKNFGPYFHKEARIIEFPRTKGTFAQAFPGTMPYSESFGFIADLRDTTKNNVINAVVAHEMGHQWWAHQVLGATMQGATMLSESFAEYSSLMVMKNLTHDPMRMTQFLKYDFDRYLRGRSGELEKELPLYKVENQQYIHYGKGSVILYAMQDYIGEKQMNLTLHNFLEEYRYKNPPYPTSLDFIRNLEPQVPDSMKYIINDFFKEITLYDLRMKKATYKKLSSGKYQVDLEIQTDKIKADSLGKERNVTIDDWIEIGFFMDNDRKELYHPEKMKFTKSINRISVILEKLPQKVAIDPRMILIDRMYSDNVMKLEQK